MALGFSEWILSIARVNLNPNNNPTTQCLCPCCPQTQPHWLRYFSSSPRPRSRLIVPILQMEKLSCHRETHWSWLAHGFPFLALKLGGVRMKLG